MFNFYQIGNIQIDRMKKYAWLSSHIFIFVVNPLHFFYFPTHLPLYLMQLTMTIIGDHIIICHYYLPIITYLSIQD